MQGFVIICIVAVVISGCQQNANTGSLLHGLQAQDTAAFTSMEWKEKSIDFGKIPEGRRLEIVYHFRNTGNKPLVISRVEPGCGCTVAETPKEPIAPGKEGVIKAAFDSNGRTGTQHKSISVYANTKGTQRHELAFEAEVEKNQ